MKYNSTQSGFSLVETLVAITILLIVIIGPMSIAATAARSTSFSSEQVVAFFLAQEGAEIAQKAREDILLRHFLDVSDGSYLADTWGLFADTSNSGIYKNCFSTTGCGLELKDTDGDGALKTVVDCNVSNSTYEKCKLFYNETGGRARYTYTKGLETTPYYRVINFEEISNHEIKVISTVYWRTGSQRAAQEVKVETYLFDVYGN